MLHRSPCKVSESNDNPFRGFRYGGWFSLVILSVEPAFQSLLSHALARTNSGLPKFALLSHALHSDQLPKFLLTRWGSSRAAQSAVVSEWGLQPTTDLTANFLLGLMHSQPIHKAESANFLPKKLTEAAHLPKKVNKKLFTY